MDFERKKKSKQDQKKKIREENLQSLEQFLETISENIV